MPKIKALFLAANPQKTVRLALDEEIRSVEQVMRASQYRDTIELKSAHAVRSTDLLQLLNEHRPDIVHFSGHGNSNGITLAGEDGEAKLVPTRALLALFTTLKGNIRLIVLNACYSREQAQALIEVIDCVIGMNDRISDTASAVFAAAFYRAIGFGRSIQDAFDQGRVSLLLEDIPEDDIPELLVKNGVDPRNIVLITSQNNRKKPTEISNAPIPPLSATRTTPPQSTPTTSKPIEVFISYSHNDRHLRDELAIHLYNLKRQGLILDWFDGDILPGAEWRSVAQQHLNTAQIILLLISSDFMASDYAYSTEMYRALERNNAGEARVIPILLRTVDYEGSPFAHLSFLPDNYRPVNTWEDRDKAFLNIVQGIRRAIRDLQENNLLPPVQRVTTGTGPGRLSAPSFPHRLAKVFVKSGFPEITFVERDDFFLLKLAIEQPGRGIVIEGPSGVGKTTIVEKAVKDLERTGLSAQVRIQDMLSAREPADYERLKTLAEWHQGTVIIDDFHRIDLSLRQKLVDYLKKLADTNSQTKKIVVVGIPRTGQALVDLSPDIATRLDVFTLGRVTDDLIQKMIEKGEHALNVRFDGKSDIIATAEGSLNLAQFLCFNLCAMARIVQAQEQTYTIPCDIETAVALVMVDLARKFVASIQHFIAMGGPRDATCLHLLEELATAEDGFLSLPQLQDKRADLTDGIDLFIRECWMDKLHTTYPDSLHLLFFDAVRQALVIDDPQLAFYLKKVRFSALAKAASKILIPAQRKVFVCYSHKDIRWLELLQTHLKPVEREGIIELWDDTKIAAGLQWKEAIMKALTTSRVAVLLISADFLASDFIAEHELPTLLSQAQAAGTIIIPVILSPSLFESTNLSAFNTINGNDTRHPLSSMTKSKQAAIFVKIAQTILECFKPK